MAHTPTPLRTLLFTPANRPAAFDKALNSGADVVCLDLEDAVPPAEKAAARDAAIAFLAQPGPGHVQRALRINAISSLAGLDDLTALLRQAPQTGMVVLPKVGSPDEISLVSRLLDEAGSGLSITALIETLDGVEAVSGIAQASPRLRMLLFGGVDLSAEMGVENADTPLAYARSRVVHAGKRAGLDVMDVPSLDFRNAEAIRQEAERARCLGFTGKAAIHPAGITPINEVFTPSAEEIDEAKRLIAAFDASPNGLAVVDGQLIELPVVRAMQRRLAIATVCGVAEG